ncbi:MAG: SGNH/GDSL hydrolase family protein, partial [Hyphomicrobiaceae bacterium]|nr:SGNH/GDSL hydrolase family protein [Hyphomicrobiaceae bacterium]
LHVCGDSDTLVPMEENTDILEERYKKLGGRIQTIIKKGIGHHPHSLKDPTKIVRFICEHTAAAGKPFFALRDDLANCRLHFKQNKIGRVAFLGGSITNMNGWRSQVAQMLQKRFPDTKFDFINAGISSTDSTLGAFRLQNDVFSRGPVDLLFVEFAVNDQHNRRTATERIRGMEGIIRQARTKNPLIDIVLLYCADPIKHEQFNSGHTPLVIQSHETVARYYGIPSINLAREVFERMNTGEFTWKTFGGLHPGKFGHRLYTDAITRFCDAVWTQQSASGNNSAAHYLPLAPLDRYNYSRGRYIEPEQAQTITGWQLLPSWNTDHGTTRQRFRDIPMLVAEEPDAVLKLKFHGTAVGLLVVAGPDAGVLEYRVDGGAFRQLDQFTQWSPKLHIPWAYMLATELAGGEHELTLRTADKKNPDSLGHAARIVKFLVN